MLVLAIGCSAEAPPPPLPPSEQIAAEAAVRRNASTIRPDIAERSFPDPLSITDAESILMATELCDMAVAGFPPGRQVQAFNVLLDQRDAANRLRRLARDGRIVGQLYALCGLLAVQRPEGVSFARAIVLVFANELSQRLRNRRDEAYLYFRLAG